jgi:hypothetical protein
MDTKSKMNCDRLDAGERDFVGLNKAVKTLKGDIRDLNAVGEFYLFGRLTRT